MKKITILSATSGQNFLLAKQLENILKNLEVSVKIVNLENFDIPLFMASDYNNYKDDIGTKINDIVKELLNSDGIIVCAPEYNGCIPPIVTNMISWISVSTKNWRDGFINKSKFSRFSQRRSC